MSKLNKTLGLSLALTLITSLLIPAVFVPEPTLADTTSTITRLGGQDRYDTAAEIARSGWTRSDYALIAFGENYPDALAAAPLAYKHNAPILQSRRTSLPEPTKVALNNLQVKNVIIVGGPAVVSESVEAELRSMGLNVSRVFGYDRYETAVEIAKLVTPSASSVELFVVTGGDYPDALSVGSIAAFKQMPIILVQKDVLPNSVRNYLSIVNVSRSYVVGGTDIISDSVYRQFPSGERILGADKYARNIAVLERFDAEFNSNTIIIATGEVFADALTGTVYAAKQKEPILLISNNSPNSTKTYYQEKTAQISSVYVFGGTGIIPDSAITNLSSSSGVTHGNLTVGEKIDFGGYEWRVLDVRDGRALLLSEYVIESRRYHERNEAITWENSTLRRYLNNEFYNSFTAEERRRIAETRLRNANNQWYGTNGGNDTTDRIFLLSLEEVVQYFGDSGQLRNRPGNSYYIDDQYNNARIAVELNGNAHWWWLRSPGSNTYNAALVSDGGFVDVDGFLVSSVRGGVRPALWLNL